MGTNRRCVLFVDDEPRILEGIARMLRPQRNEMDILMAPGGEEALAMLATAPVDVVVSDMRMPLMDGATLLAAVRERHPRIVRIILSGQSDRQTIIRATCKIKPKRIVFLRVECRGGT
jgi:YesN/AraC family two-component response regulator